MLDTNVETKNLLQEVMPRKLQLFRYRCRMNNSRKVKSLVLGLADRPCTQWAEDIVDDCCRVEQKTQNRKQIESHDERSLRLLRALNPRLTTVTNKQGSLKRRCTENNARQSFLHCP